MRLIIEFKSLTDFNYYDVNKYNVQGFIYSLLKNTEFKDYHDMHGFKFFNFSNIFPVSNFKYDEHKKLIISSPSSAFIKLLYYKLSNMDVFRLNKYYFEIVQLKLFKSTCSNSLISGTPLILFEDKDENRYFSFNGGNLDFDFFFKRLKDNAEKKYNAYTGENYILESDLFDNFEFNREVSIELTIRNNTFLTIGNLWKELSKDIRRDDKHFYNFLFDVGLGEKNSMGFGFLNNNRRWKKNAK
ncbi:CRISPR-associated endoribonuclease Cas6 [uncultured Methanosphaera sp.]|uniref:CRISPR-associated endoribonuclease Cas6 n=1 Tax=uncultured Methanosphaera sp. TaxID=262501 RepID=UPI002805F1C2|nr:CRISPR-associated endoribonuclease Cas6 [uncultured Methanosphaera sp.]